MSAARSGHVSHPGTSPKWAHATYTFPRPSAATSGSQSSPFTKPITCGVENEVGGLLAADEDATTTRSATTNPLSMNRTLPTPIAQRGKEDERHKDSPQAGSSHAR